MTEAEWLACTEPRPMLEFLRDKTSDRKFRLYLCGGCCHIAHLFYHSASLDAVEVAERFADGGASEEELHRANYAAEVPTFGYDFEASWWGRNPTVIPRLIQMGALPESALHANEWQPNESVKWRLLAAASLAEYSAGPSPRESDWALDGLSRVDWPERWLFDCVFGNPFRLMTIDSRWLTWNDGTIVKLAHAIYEERTFDCLPILADALEEAGCADADILNHCRQAGEHVRGCWVIDLLLGKS